MRDKINKGLVWYRDEWVYMVVRLPFHLAYFFGAFPTIGALLTPGADSWKICGAAFTTFAVVASVSFGFARALDSDDARRADIVFAGERAFHASIVALGALFVVYGASRWPGFKLMSVYAGATIALMIAGLASVAAFQGYRAIVILDAVLSGRPTDYWRADRGSATS